MRSYISTIRIKSILALAFCAISWTAVGQPGNDSPYSRYGIGNIIDNGNIRSAGLGGLYVAMDKVEERQVNFLNPASYVDIDSSRVVLDASVNWTIAQLSDQSGSENVNKANFGHVALGFPITKWLGSSFGLRPLSTSDYRVSKREQVPEVDSAITHIFEGDGGLNQFYFGLAARPVKGLSIGVNLAYIFGSYGTIQRLEYAEPDYVNTRFSNSSRISSIYLDYGLQYRVKKGKSGVTIGLTAAAPWQLSGNLEQIGVTYTQSFGEDLIRDTVFNFESSESFIQMPLKLGAGVTYTFNNKISAGVQFNNENWSDFRTINGQTDSLQNSWRISAGIELRPQTQARGWYNYFKKIQYRMGGFYAKSPIMLNGTQVPQYGITLGFGFPIKHRSTSGPIVSSIINGAIEIGQRGDPGANHLIEQYINFKLGFSLNDRWFLKRKYN